MLAVIAPLVAIPLIILAAMLLVPLILFLMVFWIWMLVSAIQNKGLTDGEKTGWVLGIVFFHLLGSLLYFFIGRPRRKTPLLAT
jgi:membrane protein implicated in regulation of membrane protease activity